MSDAMLASQERLRALGRITAPDADLDILIVGGGITGAGIAHLAASLGLKVALVEQRDYAWGTSSRSSKMVHGGLRYLGSGQLRLTRDAVREREALMSALPGLIYPLHYLFPHYRKRFPGPRLFGLLLTVYDWIAGRRNHEFKGPGETLQWAPGLNRQSLLGASRFGDAGTDDARLVMRILQEARALGAITANYVRVTGIGNGAPKQATLLDEITGTRHLAFAKVIINATGAWTDELRTQLGGKREIRPLRGSHLTVPFWQLPVSCAVSLFHPQDRRPVFIFPWQGATIIGTTDLDHRPNLDEEPGITDDEVDYLFALMDHAFPGHQVTRDSIVSSWAGVRPVVSSGDDKAPSKEKREHALWDNQGFISIAGGKLTTYRLIAREVLLKAMPYLPDLQRVTASAEFTKVPQQLSRPANIPYRTWQRLCGSYGPALPGVLQAGSPQPVPGTDTLWAELCWAASQEDVVHLDDLLLRRTRLGLILPKGGEALLPALKAHCGKALGWTESQWHTETQRYRHIWRQAYHLPQSAQVKPHG
ncbi:MAG: glycerol-3-phosphate dehydrogenase/oxidase [Marinobacter sp.]|nr:glycerol-3-phosphate dehydrogenase/oxidase [Marinobacter sp.]